MPCRSDFGDVGCDHSDYINEIDELTQNLCFLCGELQGDGLFRDYSNTKISKWWAEHQEKDTKRVRDVILKKWAKSKKRDPAKVADELYRVAVKIHPVSDYHKKWFLTMTKGIDRELTKKEKQARERREKRSRAISKLSSEERKLLNIKD